MAASKRKSSTKSAKAPVAFVSEPPVKPAKQKGRPCTYTEAIAAEICERLAAGETLRQVCKDPRMPPPSTVRLWVLDDREGFAERFARARDLLIEHWADEILDIADDATNDWMERHGKDGETAAAFNPENVNRARVRIDSRKWLLSKLKPGRYGDRISTELSGPGGGPIELDDINKTDVARRVAAILNAGIKGNTNG